jgi:hypothetical protein
MTRVARLAFALCTVVLGLGYASPAAADSHCNGKTNSASNYWAISIDCQRESEVSATESIAGGTESADVKYFYQAPCLPVVGEGGGSIQCDIEIPCGDGGTLYTLWAAHPGGKLEERGTQCLEPAQTEQLAPPQVTPGMVLAAFRRVPLPDSQLTIAPPGGKTLVGLDTILSTEAEPFTEVLTLLGQRVELAIEPAQFTWVHGDGTSQTTDEPGVPYTEGRPMSDYVAHRYAAVAEQLALRVDTTWSARFRVNGGPWQDVGDTVTIEGPPVGLEVVEAEPNLVGS